MKVNTDEARKQASKAITETQRQALSTVRDARKQARRQLVRARVATAKARARAETKASRTSTKAAGAAGAIGFAAGYFLDPDSGRRRRSAARGRALSLVKRGAGERPSPNDQDLTDRVKSARPPHRPITK